jgi:spermidine synthase
VWAERSEFFEIEIVDLPIEGRSLFLDSMLQSTASSEAAYHRALIQPAIDALSPDGPRDVLILGAGECATVRDVLRAPSVERVVAVDIDERLIAAVLEFMPQWHAGALDDPRVELRIEDVRETIDGAPVDSFDMIVVDLTDPVEFDPSDEDVAPALNDEFLAGVRRILRPHGVVTAQIGERSPPAAAGIVSPVPALHRVFGQVDISSVDIPAFGGDWSFALAGAELRV